MKIKYRNSNLTKMTRLKLNSITLGILFIFSIIIGASLNFNAGSYNYGFKNSVEFTLDNVNLKASKVSGKIHIDNNWTAAEAAGICTGNGTYSNPYVIEDLIIDGGGLENCIWIENSSVYFRIENCTLYNSGDYNYAGIQLSYVNNSQLINNNCSSNFYGIWLWNSNNNTILGNNANNNEELGIYLLNCNNNTILNNIINNNICGIYLTGCNNTISGNIVSKNQVGIHIFNSDDTIVSGNIMNNCGLIVSSLPYTIGSPNIDITNLVNGKPLYYYFNEGNLGSNDFTNAGQVILVKCNDSIISNLQISNTSVGISLHYCNNITVSGNDVNNNKICAIDIYSGYYNNISRNNLIDNGMGIYLRESNDNIISGNTANNNTHDGITLYSSWYNDLSGNTANNNKGIGIFLSLCYYTMIRGNNLNNNMNGIWLDASSFNTVLENTANNNKGIGIFLSLCVYNTISKNNFNNNTHDGIALYSSWDNDLSGNTANINSKNGIKLDYSWRNNLSGNIANINSKNGIKLYASDYNDLLGNTANENNQTGIKLIETNYNIISGNIANENNQTGIELIESDFNLITGNTLIGNNICISEVDCVGNYFRDNDCRTSSEVTLDISGYSLLFLLGIISLVFITFSNKIKKSSRFNS